jgi:dTDP-4-dehydrorhamnose reductase
LIFPENLSKAIEKNKHQKLIHFSSDFVFDGDKGTPYIENDMPNPLNVYGKHKLESEMTVRRILTDRVKVIRFSSLICKSQGRKNFVEKVVDRARSGEEVSVVEDLRISMATSELITEAIENIFKYEKDLFHVVHPGETSWFQIAKQAFETLNLQAKIKPVGASLFQSIAPRPQYSVMEPSKEILSLNRLSWSEALVKFLQENSRSI